MESMTHTAHRLHGRAASGRGGLLLSILLLFVLAASPTALSAQLRPSQPEILARSGQARVPFRYENGFIVVEVIFHHILPLRFIVDTGAEYSILTQREISELLGFPSDRHFTLIGADMSTLIEADLIRGVDLRLEGLFLPSRDVLVTREDYFRFYQFTGSPIHGILGADVLHRFALTIDYQRKELIFHDPGRFTPPVKAEAIPLELHRNKPFLSMSCQIDEQRPPMTLKILMDTGAALTLLLLADSHPNLSIPDHAVAGILGIGLGGFIQGARGRIRGVSMGSFPLEAPVANFQHIHQYPDTSLLHGRHGLIGNHLLEHFHLTIDYPRKTLYLQANRKTGKALATDRSGLFLLAAGSGLRSLLVQEVATDSPAWEAGIRPGDRITHLNGMPIRWLGLDTLNRRMRRAPGTSYRLTLRRGEERIQIRIRLRDYL
jgi:hypothetical protein